MTADQLREWAAAAPPGTLIPAASLAACLPTSAEGEIESRSNPSAAEPVMWRERLWICHPDVRLGVPEVAEALDRAESWVYRHTSAKSGLAQLPHRKLDGVLQFVAGEIREWIQRNEVLVVASPRRTLEFKRTA